MLPASLQSGRRPLGIVSARVSITLTTPPETLCSNRMFIGFLTYSLLLEYPKNENACEISIGVNTPLSLAYGTVSQASILVGKSRKRRPATSNLIMSSVLNWLLPSSNFGGLFGVVQSLYDAVRLFIPVPS